MSEWSLEERVSAHREKQTTIRAKENEMSVDRACELRSLSLLSTFLVSTLSARERAQWPNTCKARLRYWDRSPVQKEVSKLNNK